LAALALFVLAGLALFFPAVRPYGRMDDAFLPLYDSVRARFPNDAIVLDTLE